MGRGYNDLTPEVLQKSRIITTNIVYKEWLMEFCPPDNISKCGISFGVNGVCQTYAAREMLVGMYDADVRDALKNYVAIMWYGKYGFGLDQLKQLLTTSHQKSTNGRIDQFNALQHVLNRVDNYLDDELVAWFRVATEYIGIPVSEILAKAPTAGMNAVHSHLRSWVNIRESVYQDLLNGKVSRRDFDHTLKVKLLDGVKSYLTSLTYGGFMTESEAREYYKRIDELFTRFIGDVAAERSRLLSTGIIHENN